MRVSRPGKRSVLLFFAGVIAIVLIGFVQTCPVIDGKAVSMDTIVQIVSCLRSLILRTAASGWQR